MSTRRIPTDELTGLALDYAVALVSGRLNARVTPDPRLGTSAVDIELSGGRLWEFNRDTMYYAPFSPSTNWVQGGPIIHREQISVFAPIVRRISAERHAFPVNYWRAAKQRDEDESITHGRGSTGLIAAMRCYVASTLGEHVDVPEELLA